MSFPEEVEKLISKGEFTNQNQVLLSLEEEIRRALDIYFDDAQKILSGSSTRLSDIPPSFFSLKYNFFSSLFLFSYYRAGIPKERRIFYTAINQCLRGMVTGCDNLLDDEYKQTLPTNLPEAATRFRSILDIMVSDRVLFELILNSMTDGLITLDQARRISAVSLRALLDSGTQEAGEENGIDHILTPEEILSKVHHYKTGLLFQAPWAIPEVIEKIPTVRVEALKSALYDIGIGCQIMDDMVDLQRDMRDRRHNYVLSVLYHERNPASPQREEAFMENAQLASNDRELLSDSPEIRSTILLKATTFLESGLSSLFSDEYNFLVEPSILFLRERIGVPSTWTA